MDRTIPFDENAVCDGCGKKGAFDFMGDFYCSEYCMNHPKSQPGKVCPRCGKTVDMPFHTCKETE